MPDTDRTIRLIYRSHSTIPDDQRDRALADIFAVARSHNADLGVTGALLITDNWFVQTLEGEESVVTGLFEKIRADGRHSGVTVVESTPVDDRVFGRWAMAKVSRVGHSDIPLHDVDGHIAPAERDATDRAQDALLTRMRNTIGADTV
ncbi:BLUF domain-containing protein [Pseudonocardia nematodicida]|uniref:BLUF domain-containing protein n=1 Tax=Pseudonocardia nematodicida TaxID=1206997 RepID=A0ABV1KKY2_9PSEU